MDIIFAISFSHFSIRKLATECKQVEKSPDQNGYAGTESKSETEKLLRKALEDYEDKKFVAKADSLTVGELLDMWAEEELKTGTLGNGTVENYLGAIRCNISS